jgi:hypothetical protein
VRAVRALVAGILVGLLLLCGCSVSGSSDAAATKKPKRPHVVLLVLDEFPGDTLLGPNGRVDAGRFPNFAALAGDSTWFHNAHTSYDSTTKAVPLVLDGIRPHPGTAPVAREHPHSIFTTLGSRGYRTVTSEEATAMCPARYCPSERGRRPAIIPNLKAGRAERFGQFIRSIKASRRPTFWMKHALLPHGPWVYLPSGHRSRPEGPELLPGMQTVPGFYDQYVTDHNEQRYLLQLGFVDRLLGRLVARLKSQGMYDHTLIVVTADHGFAWQVGVPTRRSVTQSNLNELGPVPLFVKAPGQTRGRVNEALAQTLDVTPTIADVLNVPLGYRADGRSAFSPAVRARREVSLVKRDFSSIVRMPAARWKAQRRAVVQRRLSHLGWGDWASLHTSLGPNRELIGQDVTSARSAAGRRATISLSRSFARVRRSKGFVPCQIAGRIHDSGATRERDLAIAVNGRIEAVGRSFHLKGETAESYAVMVPENALHDGRNTVEVLEVTDEGAMVLLARS